MSDKKNWIVGAQRTGSTAEKSNTDRTQAHVKESESHFRAMADASPVLIWTIDAHGSPTYYNKTFFDFIGVTKTEDISDWEKIVHPDDLDSTMKTLSMAISERHPYSLECRLLRADGTWRWVLAQGNPILGANNEFLGFVGSSVDITERREAEARIKESEKKFEAAILAVEGIIWTNNAVGEMVGEQPGWAKLTGQSFEEYQGFKWSSAVHPDDAQPTVDAWNKAVRDKSTFVFEHRLKTQHNGWRLFSVKAVPALDEKGIIKQWVGVHTDITEQREAAKKIRESESYFRSLTEKLTYRTALLEAHNQASVDGILLVDAKGKIISFNQRFTEIWNMPQPIVDAKDDEAALSFAMAQLVNPQLFIDKVKYLYEHPTETSLDELEFKDGKIVERNGYPVIGEDGSYYAWSWTFKDITKQKSYEKAIIESEQRFRILAETLPQLIWMTNEKGIYEYASSHWINYSGLDPYAKDTWQKLIHPQDLKALRQGWENSLQTGKTYHSEARLKNKKGVYNWHLVQGEPIKNEKGTIIKWIGAFTDIENLKEEQKQKNDFLSMASHELRTPVTTIKAYSQIIERILAEKDDVQTLGMVKKMSKQVNSLNTLITDLLDITRMQTGGLIRNESVFNLDDLVKEVIDDFQTTSVTHQIIDNLDADISISGDKNKLGQVLNNLLSNATKYSPAADRIIIDTKVVNDGVQLSVQDFGIGISMEGQQRVFEQFYRVTGENQATFQGMGIGLYICAEIIKKEGGNIWVDSIKGEGSVFYVWLPTD
ncbi:MAG: PAS domain-containing sensor histidine kinase [Daejeonella sp.]|uniref:PAS domain-containing sensor histidine kinase n=1 Tax=Daejeonella sp. TaxID=2805397 RepID=UPI003C76ACA0